MGLQNPVGFIDVFFIQDVLSPEGRCVANLVGVNVFTKTLLNFQNQSITVFFSLDVLFKDGMGCAGWIGMGIKSIFYFFYF